MDYSKLNDYELINMVPESEEVTDILFKKYKPLIAIIAKQQYDENINGGLDLNDIIQEGMIGFSTAISTYSEKKDTMFYTYARKCIETKIISALITATRQKHRILNSSLSMDAMNDIELKRGIIKYTEDYKSNPESIAIDKEKTKNLISKLEKELTEFEKQVFNLKKEGFSYKEIATLLDTNPKKIDNALQRIRNKTKICLSKEN